MATLTVRIPQALKAEIEAEARVRRLTKSEVIRERLQVRIPPALPTIAIADLIGSVDGLPADLSARRKHYLEITGYGKKRRR